MKMAIFASRTKTNRTMCLFISTKYHHAVNKEYKAKKVGRKPILVHKLLEWDNDMLQTPYEYLPIMFENGQRTIYGQGFISVHDKDKREKYFTAVEEGVHAYRTEESAVNGVLEAAGNEWTFEKFYGVIPTGELYFVGRDGDIVASKMIIFKSKRNLNEYLNGKETITIE